MDVRTVSRRRTYHVRDDAADFQRDGSTLPLKNAQFYKRSWTAGQPFSSMPIWSAVEHVPAKARQLVTRPDLGLAAMHRVLDHVVREKEAALETARRVQAEQYAQRQVMARRHMKRHEDHLACGGYVSPQHAYADLITAVSPTPPEPVVVEDLGGDTSMSTLAYLRRQHEQFHAKPVEADVSELSPFGTHASDLRKPPMAACYEGLEGLVIPRHAVVEKVAVPVALPRRSSSTTTLRRKQPALRCLPPEFRDYSGRFAGERPGSRIWARDPLGGVPSLSTSRPVSRATRPASRSLASLLRQPRTQPLLPMSDGTRRTCDSLSEFRLPSAPTADATMVQNMATFPRAALGLPPADDADDDNDDDQEDPAARDTPPVSPREGALVAARTKQARAKEAARQMELEKQQQDDEEDAKKEREARLLRQRAATREVNKKLRQLVPGEMYGSIDQGTWSRDDPGEKYRLVTKRRMRAGPGQRGFWKEARDIISEGSMVAADLEAEGRGLGWRRGSMTGLPVELLGLQKPEMSRLRRRRRSSDGLPGQLLARGMLKDGQVLSAFEGLVRDDSTRALRSCRGGIARPARRGGT